MINESIKKTNQHVVAVMHVNTKIAVLCEAWFLKKLYAKCFERCMHAQFDVLHWQNNCMNILKKKIWLLFAIEHKVIHHKISSWHIKKRLLHAVQTQKTNMKKQKFQTYHG